MLKFFTTNLHTVILWLPAFVLAVILRLITSKFNNQLIFPICMPIFFDFLFLTRFHIS